MKPENKKMKTFLTANGIQDLLNLFVPIQWGLVIYFINIYGKGEMMELTAKKVEEIFLDCLFKDAEIIEGKPNMEPIKVEGIVNSFGLHPERLHKYKDQVTKLLKELPSEFFKNGGGGWSFLNACVDKHGNQWGEHRNIEQLFCLGIGLNIAKYLLSRAMWPAFPGGMPYVVIY